MAFWGKQGSVSRGRWDGHAPFGKKWSPGRPRRQPRAYGRRTGRYILDVFFFGWEWEEEEEASARSRGGSRMMSRAASSGVAWRRRRPSTRSRWRQQAVAVALVSRGRESLAGLGREPIRGAGGPVMPRHVFLRGNSFCELGWERGPARACGLAGVGSVQARRGPSAVRTHRKFATGPGGFCAS